MYVTWPIHTCNTTHSCVCLNNLELCCPCTLDEVTWLILGKKKKLLGRFALQQHVFHDVTHSYEWHDSFICATWIIQMCDTTNSLFAFFLAQVFALRQHVSITHSYLWCVSFMYIIYVTGLMHMCDMIRSYLRHDSLAIFLKLLVLQQYVSLTRSYTWHDSLVYVTWLIDICDTTYAYVGHDSFIRMTWLIYMCDMTHLYVWHDSFACVTWLIYTCDMARSYMWHETFICVTWFDLCLCVTWLVFMRDMTYSYVWYDWGACAVNFNTLQHPAIHCNTLQHNVSFICVTRLRRLLCGNMFP